MTGGGSPITAEAIFGADAMARSAAVVGVAIRKACVKSRGSVRVARAVLVKAAQRNPKLSAEMVRKAIHQAAFTVAADGPPPPPVPLDTDPFPFTDMEFADMRERVHLAADAALTAASGDTAAARLALMARAMAEAPLRDALTGLSILALR